ncbi:MAG TPA: hypothetical protein VEH08_01310, partial [Methanomassiliicoccales archaeon]|nr:hypothetical protein [Methanomassiliicoccales archaeon]
WRRRRRPSSPSAPQVSSRKALATFVHRPMMIALPTTTRSKPATFRRPSEFPDWSQPRMGVAGDERANE